MDKIDQTWKIFKIHFSEQWEKMRQLRGPTMRDTAFQQEVNIIQEEVQATLGQEKFGYDARGTKFK